MMRSILKGIHENNFGCIKFITDKIARLLPPVVLFSLISFIIGYFTMLPDDFENLNESIVASDIFGNNILAAITTKNYWDVSNVYKPLMHTWYLGVLMQAYVIVPLIVVAVYSLCKKSAKSIGAVSVIITILSFGLFVCPGFSDAAKFYYLPFRLFELMLGGLAAYFSFGKVKCKQKVALSILAILNASLLAAFLFIPFKFLPSDVKLVIVSILTALLVYHFARTDEIQNAFLKICSVTGRCSLSIYLCHQVIIAFLFYFVTDKRDLRIFLLFAVILILVSFLTYDFVEKPLKSCVKKNKVKTVALSMAACIAVSVSAFVVYLNAGVVRDVPELEIYKNDVHRGMHAEYCDRPYSWDRDFKNEDKIKILVLGNSFGRDFANILYESEHADNLDISYIYSPKKEDVDAKIKRFKDADIVFYAFSGAKAGDDVPNHVAEAVDDDKLYVIGNKSYGDSNGIIYSRRYRPDYFEQKVPMNDEVRESNRILKEKYGDHFIDLMAPVQDENGEIRVFTEGNRFISQDCRHLTRSGAIYYSAILDFSFLDSDKVNRQK